MVKGRHKKSKKNKCAFTPKYGLAGKTDVEGADIQIQDITYAISRVAGVCNRSYYIGGGHDKQLMVKIAAKDKKSAAKARTAIRKAGLGHTIQDYIEPWSTVREYW